MKRVAGGTGDIRVTDHKPGGAALRDLIRTVGLGHERGSEGWFRTPEASAGR